jgi:hypothetical protein
MPLPNKTLRSLSSIRTRSGTPDGTILPYKAYMVITTLEMEKFRREAEQAKLLTRFEFIKSRLQFIASEKAEILRRLDRGQSPEPIGKPSLKRSAPPVPTRSRFTMKY